MGSDNEDSILVNAVQQAVSSLPVFIHLPKTGGTSVISLFRDNLLANQINGTGMLVYGMPPTRSSLKGALQIRHSPYEPLAVVGGQIGYRDIQAVSQDLKIPIRPFTVLRNPDERLVSFWAYLNDIRRPLPPRTLQETLDLLLPNSMYRLLAPQNR